MPRAQGRHGLQVLDPASLHEISPLSGWRTPEMILMSVDLPEPFSPTRQWISPVRIEKSTPFRA